MKPKYMIPIKVYETLGLADLVWAAVVKLVKLHWLFVFVCVCVCVLLLVA